MATHNISKLFEPIQVGDITLSHRIALSPMTRMRANSAHVHGDLAVQYYTQRASVPGTLLITEATVIAPKAGGLPHVPGIYTSDQIAAWKKVTEAVHSKGSFIYLQLWALGRTADPGFLKSEDPSFEYTSSSDVPIPGRIKEFVQFFATAAENAVHKAGFDGVEIHGANGFLVDQFLQDVCNTRTDEYGGSIENRCRFGLEVIDAVCKAVGPKKTSIRLSPWSKYEGMRMKDPVPTWTYFVSRLRDLHPDLAAIHVIEPRSSGPEDTLGVPDDSESNDFIRKIWAPKTIISAGQTKSIEIAAQRVDEWPGNTIVAIGRYFISNPDLPARIRNGIAWAPYDQKDYYTFESPKGYIDYRAAE